MLCPQCITSEGAFYWFVSIFMMLIFVPCACSVCQSYSLQSDIFLCNNLWGDPLRLCICLVLLLAPHRFNIY